MWLQAMALETEMVEGETNIFRRVMNPQNK